MSDLEIPFCICPRCAGAGCDYCEGEGEVPASWLDDWMTGCVEEEET